MSTKSIQLEFAPNLKCFGCGPANDRGLRIASFPRKTDEEGLEAQFFAEAYMEAFPGVVSGGIVGTLLDCHANWTAAWHLMRRLKLAAPPCTVTAKFSVELLAPTPNLASNLAPSPEPLLIVSQVLNSSDRKVEVAAELGPQGKAPTAKLNGVFVLVKEGHPAFHRW